MTGILSLVTFLPMVGVAALALLKLTAGRHDQSRVWEAARWITLATTVATFAISLVVLFGFDPGNPGFQFLEDFEWFAGVHYRMGVDGISILFVILTTFLMPLCI